MTYSVDSLLELLPQVYRDRDAETGGSLAALMAVIAEQAVTVDADILRLYDDWFIETCQDWLAPYIGDLLRVRYLNPVTVGTSSQRAFVANTLRYRRAKGTLAVLELLASDVTGWRARAVEFFQLLDWTQYAKHIRPRNLHTPDLRDSANLELIGGPFDTCAHVAEVRSAARGGRYNLGNVGLYLWRLTAYPLVGVTPRKVQGQLGYTFSPLGLDLQLFNPAPDGPPPDRLATEIDVPAPLRRRPLFDELEAFEASPATSLAYFGGNPVLRVFNAQGEIDKKDIDICDLSTWTQPSSGISVDPVLGRLMASKAAFVPVRVDHAYGFSGDLGGGPYDRRQSIKCWFDPKARAVDWQAAVLSTAAANSTSPFPDVIKAVAAWNTFATGNAPAFGVIAVTDNASYDLSGLATVVVPAGSMLAIVAAGVPDLMLKGSLDPTGLRAHLMGDVNVHGTAPANADDPGEFVMSGLLLEGKVVVQAGNLGRLQIDHCTLEPRTGNASLMASGNPDLDVAFCKSISGEISLADGLASLKIEDSIVDGVVSLSNPQPVVAIAADETPVTIDGTTVLGTTLALTLKASASLFYQPVTVARRQAGCVRFCYLPAGSSTPRRFRCQPDLAIAAAGAPPEAEVRDRLQPVFTSVEYGHSGYCQLHVSAAEELRTGAEDGSEIGAFSFLKQPQRVQNLHAALDEYLRAGLAAGIFYVT